MIDFTQTILTYLERLVSVPGISATEHECLAAAETAAIVEAQSYFKTYPQLCGKPEVEGDSLRRPLPFGLVKGRGRDTVILTGHYDVVGVSEYGPYQEAAFDPEKLHERLLQAGPERLGEEAWADLQSGEWLFGRGTADMKGGLAIGLALLEQFGEQVLKGTVLSGNVLFLAVPDEESYSAGMRGALPLLLKLKEAYHLEYSCLIDLEPSRKAGDKLEVHIGSAGKCMPVILVQGKKAHVGACYDGINAIGVLGEMFRRTEFQPVFADRFEGEAGVPPTWLKFRDLKAEYDVSVPHRACGYLNMITFLRTPEQLLAELLETGRQSWTAYLRGMAASRQMLLSAQTAGPAAKQPEVLEYRQLLKLCKRKNGFAEFYQGLYEKSTHNLQTGHWNYPDATVEFMQAMLDFSGLTEPVMVIGFAPPYYPAFHSDKLGKAGMTGTELFQRLSEQSVRQTGAQLQLRHYFTGISDLSYCGLSAAQDMTAWDVNTPLWGTAYTIDFAALASLQIPSVLYGPWGKDLHQMTERVNRKNLTEEIPVILKNFIEQMFAK